MCSRVLGKSNPNASNLHLELLAAMAKFIKAVFAESHHIDSHDCGMKQVFYRFTEHSPRAPLSVNAHPSEKNALPKCDVLEHPSGWKFYSFHRHIITEQEQVDTIRRIKELLAEEYPSVRAALRRDEAEEEHHPYPHPHPQHSPQHTGKKHDDHLEINGYKLHLPPMLFAADLMLMGLPENRGALSISPTDALLAWAAQHTLEDSSHRPLHVPKVPYANKWINRMIAEKVIEGVAVPEGADTAVFTQLQASDWTFSTDYCCTLHAPSGEDVLDYEALQTRQVLRAFNLTSPTQQNSSLRVEVASQSGIDIDMLKRRDLPILFYDELTLFEDDLEDCGEVSFDAKIRVMPTCWFLLSKFFVRIDDVIVRCRESRLFHKFGDVTEDGRLKVSLDVTWREKKLQSEGPLGGNMMRTKYNKNNAHELPMVNESLGIPQSYTLFI